MGHMANPFSKQIKNSSGHSENLWKFSIFVLVVICFNLLKAPCINQ